MACPGDRSVCLATSDRSRGFRLGGTFATVLRRRIEALRFDPGLKIGPAICDPPSKLYVPGRRSTQAHLC